MDPVTIMSLLGLVGAGGSGGGQNLGTMLTSVIKMGLGAKNAMELGKIERPLSKTLPGVTNAANTAQQRAQFGFDPTQRGRFEGDLSRVMATDAVNTRSAMGGGFAQALLGRQVGQRLSALNQFAAEDATKQQSNQRYSDELQKYLQSQDNIQTQQMINYRRGDEAATGQTLSDGLNSFGSAINANQALNYFGQGGFANTSTAKGPGGPGYGSYFPTPKPSTFKV